MAEQPPAVSRLLGALRGGDTMGMRTLLASDLWLREHIDEPWGYFDAPAIVEASSRGDADMMRVLAEAGARRQRAVRMGAGRVRRAGR